jgi:pyruvate/2-oxoglutarate dehydrogenase complex dihydrolipoamide dehydrogenase (E3) component
MGEAKFTGAKTVEVRLNDGGSRTITGEHIFLNIGTHASIPAVPGLAESEPLTNIELLELDRLPEHLIVIGGGYVGLEFAQAYRRFGSKITILQRGPQLLDDQDPDVVNELSQALIAEGIDILTSAEVMSVKGRSGSSVSVVVRTRSTDNTIEASDILVATGRTPNTTGIGLELAGVELEKSGYIKVNDRRRNDGTECLGSRRVRGQPAIHSRLPG